MLRFARKYDVNPPLGTSLPFLLALFLMSCGKLGHRSSPPETDSNVLVSTVINQPEGAFKAHQALSGVLIDGQSKDSIWSNVDWYGMNYAWMGGLVDSLDYYGKFKLAWDSLHLYVLVEVLDDSLHPTLADGIENYWKGDYVEVFVDEDASGGVHQYSHQAFAYHVSTEGHAIDKNVSKETVFFDNHIEVKRTRTGTKHIWEMAIKLYDSQFNEHSNENEPVRLTPQKRIGFSIAYGDNDGNHSREHFMGSKMNHGTNNDEGYINADVFGEVLFID